MSPIASTTSAEGEQTRLLGHAGVEDDLQQKVAELVREVDEVAAGDGVGDLVGLLDGVGRDGREVLLEVPGAARARGAQRGHQGEEPADIPGSGGHADRRAVG